MVNPSLLKVEFIELRSTSIGSGKSTSTDRLGKILSSTVKRTCPPNLFLIPT